MKLTEKAKKRLTLAGLGVVCVVLVIAIASQFKEEAPKETDVKSSATVKKSISPLALTPEVTEAPTPRAEVSVRPITPTESVSKGTDTGDSTGTHQRIQAEVKKPAKPSKKVKTNPSKKPDGQKVAKSGKRKTSSSKAAMPKSGDKNSKGQVWVPGFGWVNDEGANSGTSIDGEGDINKQVGNMN